ncbi:MAG TPA: rRNA maturation RNase YbeY [Acidobacteriaceae bacterium]|nr:rRNA maturation RNase YbeY [Acidobacteriaceae bacterium]
MILIEPTIQARFGRRLRLRTLSGFLESASAAAKLRGEVSVLLTGDAPIRRLNRQFRHKDTPTDVLSFPALDVSGDQSLAGDLAISVETAARQAEDRGHALAVELQILMLHGLLHLAGYDHEQDSGQMARREATLRRRLGLSQGLIERSGGGSPVRSQRRGVRQP